MNRLLSISYARARHCAPHLIVKLLRIGHQEGQVGREAIFLASFLSDNLLRPIPIDFFAIQMKARFEEQNEVVLGKF